MAVRIRRGSSAPGQHWLEPPRLRTVVRDDERHASWLELFFDLVFVVAITELSRLLVGDHSARGFLVFALLFVPVWVAWQGYMAYATRFDTDDLAFRVAYFAAMLAIAALAVQTEDVAHGTHSAGFAISYGCLRSIMLLLYLRAWLAVPEARRLVRFYGIGYALGVALWLGSLLVPPPARYGVWIVAQIFELSLPWVSTQLHRRIPTDPRHLPERWALFTLIVLGESVAVVALQTSETHWNASAVVAGVLGFTAVAGVWWLYYDRAESVALRGSALSVVVYSYAHLPLLIGLAAMSAGLRLLIDNARADRLGWGPAVALLGGAVVFLLSLIGTRTVVATTGRRRGVRLKFAASVAILVLLAAQPVLPPPAVAAILAAIFVAAVYLERRLFPDRYA
jgi:low temperature requirement protein LtrA